MAPVFLFGFDVIPQATEEINMPLKNVIAKNTMLEMMKHYYAQYGLKNFVFRFPTIYS